MKRPPIVVIGSANTDLVVRVASLPRPGETVTGGSFQIVAGGKGANQAVAAARAGARVTFIGNIGCDRFGDAALQGLSHEGIDTHHVVRSRATHSGVALIMVDARGENLISVAQGSNEDLQPEDVDAAEADIRQAKCLVAQLEVPLPAVRRAIELAHRHGVPVLLNPAPAQSVPFSILRRVSFLTPNQFELHTLTGQPIRKKADLESAALQLHRRGPRHVLVTCGARGVCWCSASGLSWIPAPAVRAIDTVGAGDCFAGGFAVALAEGRSVGEAARFAVTAASISVTRLGAQPSMPERRDILRHLTNPGQSRFRA